MPLVRGVGEAAVVEVGARNSFSNPSQGVRTKVRFRRTIRVQVPSGSFNLDRRGELVRGDTYDRGSDFPGDRVIEARR